MTVGQNVLVSGFSYLMVGRETTYGTYNTCTAALEHISASIKTTKESKVLEQIESSRTYSKSISLGKKIEGSVDYYFTPELNAVNYLLQNAFGGTVTSATATGETAGGAGFTHTFEIGAMDQSYPSLCLNVRKGDSASGKIFEYSGVRVNELMWTAELDEPLKLSATFMAKDSTVTTNNLGANVTPHSYDPLTFVNGRFSVESSFASLTSTSYWHVQSIEFGMNNSLKADNDSRRIGSDVLDVMPPGIMTFQLSATIRFDTTTAYDAMMNHTEFAAEFEFQGSTMSGSVVRRGVKVRFPKVVISDAGDPEIGGPDEVLKSQVTFLVLRDDSSATGYACQALVTNNVSSYA